MKNDATSTELAAERRAREESDAAAHILRALEDVTQAALAPHSLDELLGTVVVRCAATFDVERASITIAPRGNAPRSAWATSDGAVRIEHLTDELMHADPVLDRIARGCPPGTIASSEPRHAPWVDAPGWSSACAPLRSGDEVLGIVEVLRRDGAFTRNDVGLLQLLADRVAVAADRARAWENERSARRDAERARHQASTLFTITSETADLLAQDTIHACVFNELARYLDARAGIAFAMDELQPVLRSVGHHGVQPDECLDTSTVPITDGGVLADSIRAGGIITIDSTSLDEADVLARRPWAGIGTIIVVPVLTGARVRGVYVFMLQLGALLGDSDENLLIAASQQAGAALDRAQLATERRRMYEAERAGRADAERRAQAARILDVLSEGVLLVDDAGVLRSCNPTAANILDLDLDHALGRQLVASCPAWSDVAATLGAVDAGPSIGASGHMFELAVHDRTAWVRVSAVRSSDGVVYAVRDQSDEREVDALRRDLVSTVSHELRTPIATVYGAAVTLARTDVDIDAGTRDELLDMIQRESERLGKLVDDLLVVQKLDADRLRLTFSPHSIVDVVTEAFSAFRIRGNTSAHELVVRVDDDVRLRAPVVSIDSQRMQQVLSNLLENARSYSAPGSAIELRVSTMSERGVRVSVVDHGVGIPSSHHDRIFERFYRVDPDMRSGVGGMGLGLFLSRELVRAMGGDIGVRSRPGHGSTFVVELPTQETCG